MKFTKEQAVEKLNQTLTNGGKKTLRMSARTLESQTETLMALVANEEMELDEFVEKIKANLESINSNIEHDQSEFIRDYEKKHQKEEPKVEPSRARGAEDETQAELLKRIEELERANQQAAEDAILTEKRNGIRKYLSDNNVKNKEWIDAVMNMTSVGKDDVVEDKGKSILDLYNKTLMGGDVIVPGSPSPGGGITEDAFNDVKSIRKRRVENQK